MNKSLLLLVLCMLLPTFADAQAKKVFVTTDENGVLVFSDSPQVGAEEVNFLARPNVMPATDPTLPKARQPASEQYEISIMQPEDQATVRDNTGSVHVSGRITPSFKRGLRVKLLIDGQAQAEPQNSTIFVLRDIERGEHKLEMQLLDATGKVIATSPVSTFYLHRASRINPN